MKIAFLSYYYGEVQRGGETFVAELAKRLSGNNTVEIIGGNSTPKPSWPVLWRVFLDPQGISVLIHTINKIGKIWKEKYDIVIPMDGGWEALLVRLVTSIYGGKVVISGQSGKGWFDRINILSFPDAFVHISSWSLSKLEWMNPAIRHLYIPNGVDPTKFKKEGKTYSTKLDRPIVLTVGALVPSKRIDLVIRAVRNLPDVNLLIVGTGPEKQRLTELAERLIPGRFEFTSVKHAQMPEIYRAADVFAFLPESSEAFGIVYLEAMATGLPVVGPADAQRQEIVGEGGLLVEHADEPEDIAFAIDLALERSWNNSPRSQAQKFSWDAIAAKYEKLFIELCQK